jgi:hypothetical protein
MSVFHFLVTGKDGVVGREEEEEIGGARTALQ